VAPEVARSNSPVTPNWEIAQLAEHAALTREVVGSLPTLPAKLQRRSQALKASGSDPEIAG
jgi:hypothetical protein